MPKSVLASFDKKRLRRWLLLFFFALLIPAVVLIAQAYSQLKWEAFHQYNIQAEELTRRIDDRLNELIKQEESRAYTDYSFLNVAGEPSANFFQRSPLSKFPAEGNLPGVLGYFQVDANGQLSTPLLPDSAVGYKLYGISDAELEQRLAAQEGMHKILSENRLVRSKASPPSAIFVEKAPMPLKGVVIPPAEISSTPLALEEEFDDSDSAQVSAQSEPQVPESEMNAQAAFDRLSSKSDRAEVSKSKESKYSLGRVVDLRLDSDYQQRAIRQRSVEERDAEEKREPSKDTRRYKKNKMSKQASVEGVSGKSKSTTQMAASKPAPLAKSSLTRRFRKERSVIAQAAQDGAELLPGSLLNRPEVKVRIFESEVDGFQLSLLNSGHFVLYRNVWRDGQRFIQGALMEQSALLDAVVGEAFNDTSLAKMSDLIVAYQGDVIRLFNGNSTRSYLSSAQELTGELLHRSKLSPPLSEIELLYSINRLPPGSGQQLIHWVAAVLLSVLVVGFYLLYRLASKQLDLVKQQQDFVSAVSHELKTPLTSIRMYGEMLREGWASEEKKNTYYEFIHDESERLSRLITNVLQLARMTRNELNLELTERSVTELIDGIRSKISTQVESAAFQLELTIDEAVAAQRLLVDPDGFCQVMINLVDNAIKFSGKSDRLCIQLSAESYGKSKVIFKVRDFGPGIPKDQIKQIFRLFYRPKDELTRETIGTGIGLALVHQLITAMGGSIDVVNREPGAEFRVCLPLEK